jgi:2-polyprenyl-6-hydroxyphenyl methylase/3-demethylubiquinone-9 3-methyltransferase
VTPQADAGLRFGFGRNWRHYLSTLDADRIAEAERSLLEALGGRDLAGRSVLDIGSGSGLFSLAALRLGAARVQAFDYDPDSVAATAEVKRRFAPETGSWRIEQGSVLDRDYLRALGAFDLVYAWGVLHHTGDQWRALANAADAVAEGGRLYVALYNDQGRISRYWSVVKRAYNSGAPLRWTVIAVHAPYLLGLRFLARALTGRLRLERGMSLWHDMLDWLGGYPFEVATPAAVEGFLQARGFTLTWSRLVGRRHGANQYVFQRRRAAMGGA